MDKENQQLLSLIDWNGLKQSDPSVLDLLQKVKNNVKIDNQTGEQFWTQLKKLIEQLHSLSENQLSKGNPVFDWLESINGIFLILQCSCINNLENQNYISENFLKNLIDILSNLIDQIDTCHSQSITKTVRFCLRCFANQIAGENNRKPRQLLWNGIRPLFSKLMSLKDISLTPIISMIIYTCHCNQEIFDQTINDQQLVTEITCYSLDLLQEETLSSEWNLYTLDSFTSSNNFFSNIFLKLDSQHRETLLDFLCHRLEKNCDSFSNLDSISYLGQLLSNCLFDVFRLNSQSEYEDTQSSSSCLKFKPFELSKLLHLLAQLSSSESCNQLLRTNQSLVEQTIETLKCCQLLGKAKNGIGAKFEIISNLKKLNQLSTNDELNQDPIFGFKRDLIRLIGNFSYKCSQVQDWVRQKDGIPVILDCANLDARNPFIMQWAIFAIRNLMENNPLNQEIIAGLARNGILIDSPLLKELGLKFENGQIIKL